jgi:trehalose 6-phosphate synthase
VSRLVVVSNRVASPKEMKPGGLAVAMLAALREQGGLWFGWSGSISGSRVDEGPSPLKEDRVGPVDYVTMDLSRKDYDEYYAGFANRTLWPLFHFRPGLVDFDRQAWAGYLRVNALFADRLAALLRPNDQVWIHDYHLLPLAAMLRERGVRARIGFFLHTPLPPPDLLRMLPVHRELFGALVACDIVGFHTRGYVAAFHDYVVGELGAEVNERGVYSVQGGRHSFRVAAFPIGVDPLQIAGDAGRASELAAARRLQQSLEGKQLVIGVDRLDYSKGLPERFRAYGRFLSRYPDCHRRVALLQIAPSSRGEVPEYRELRRELEGLAGAINGRWAEPDWVPLRYVNKAFQPATLAGFYRLARVGLVTPFRDGMNLVAKEYVCAQDPEDPGVLVLSRFAGAAEELAAAVLVNPYDADGVARALHAALLMPLAERRARWEAMMAVLRRNDIDAWRRSFLAMLSAGEAATLALPRRNDDEDPDHPELAGLRAGLGASPARRPRPGDGRGIPGRSLHR